MKSIRLKCGDPVYSAALHASAGLGYIGGMKHLVWILCLATGPVLAQIGSTAPMPALPGQPTMNPSTLSASPVSNSSTGMTGKHNFYPNRDWSAQAGQGETVYSSRTDSKRIAAGSSEIVNGRVCTHIWGGRLICR